MGEKFCHELDVLGLDEIWGVALATDKVQNMGLKTTFRFFEMDLTVEKSFDILEKTLKEEDVQVEWLVNASGFGKFGRYDEIELADQLGMVDLNCKALTHMTLLCLPFMKEGARIVEFGSVASFQPTPYIAVYGASKAYVLSFSRAMNRELKSRKISVTCICPFWTKTAFFDRAVNPNKRQAIIKYVAMYDPSKVVKRAMKGALKRKDVVMFGFKAKAQTMLVKLLPHKLVMSVWERQQKFKKRYD